MTRLTGLLLLTLICAGCGGGERKAASRAIGEKSKVTAVNPQDLLFSIPTLNDSLPSELGGPASADCYRIHEDNWRQFEFVSSSFAAEIASELAAIDRIWTEQAVPLGATGTAFKNVHVRRRIPRPLDIPILLADFEKLLGAKASALTLIGYDRILRDVHAVRLNNVIIYGVIERDRLTTLGIEKSEKFAITGQAADGLGRLITEHGLRLVHWPSRTQFESPEAALRYLRGNGG